MAEQELVTVNVDGQAIQVPKGVMLVEAAKVVDVDIPVFCYHPKMTPVGMCRMCLVEIGAPGKNKDGTPELDEQGNAVIRWQPKLTTACTTPAAEGTHIRTANTRVADAWRGTLEFLLTSHPLDCPVCQKGGECPLQDLTFAYGPDLSRFYKRNKYHFEKPIPLGDLVWLDQERCVYCSRCIRFQEEIAGDPVLKFADRNRGQEIVTYSDPPFDSYYSGNVTDVCPVGALLSADYHHKPRPWELTNVPSVCNLCPVGCNTVLGTRSDEIQRIMPRQNEWVNEMWLCDKGRFGHHHIRAEDRLTTPLIKDMASGEFRPATWNEALTLVANRFAEVLATEGPGVVGGIAGDRTGNEDLYLFARFMREVIGTSNIDHRLRWPTNTGIEEAVYNVGLTSNSSLGNLGKNSVILTIGADLEEEQPVAYLRVRGAARLGAQLVVVQSRSTKEMMDATQTLLVKPGSEAHLAAALLRGVLAGGSADFGKLGGAEELTSAVNGLDSADLATETGLEQATLDGIVSAITGAEQLVIMVGREGLANAGANAPVLVDALVALLVATGKAGQPDSGLVALWPHNNSQGAVDMGVLPHLAAGYEPVASPGATMDEMLNGAAPLRAAYVMASDPVRDYPSSRPILQQTFLVVQDLFLTETALMADVVLPASAYAEREGTFTNMERRVQRFQAGLEPIGQSLPDWKIISLLAEQFNAEWPEYFVAADVAQEIAKKVKIYKGLTYDKLRGEGVGWTTTAGGHHIYNGTSLLNTWSGVQWEAGAEAKKPKFDLRWHELGPVRPLGGAQFRLVGQRKLNDNGTLIRRSHILDPRRARPFVKMNPLDAGAIGANAGDMVTVTAKGTDVTAPLLLDARLQPGMVVIPLNVDGAEWNALLDGGSTTSTATVAKAPLVAADSIAQRIIETRP
ncbi:MAG TPA: NADH-quinone oxidoreductase subunit NuoG [Ardenticatenaceae bacterium]